MDQPNNYLHNRRIAIPVVVVAILAIGALLYAGSRLKKCDEPTIVTQPEVDEELIRENEQLRIEYDGLQGELMAARDSLAAAIARERNYYSNPSVEHETRAFRNAGVDAAAQQLLSNGPAILELEAPAP